MDNNKTPVFTTGAIICAAGIMLFGLRMYIGWDGVSAQGTIASTHQLSTTDSKGANKTYYEATVTFLTDKGASNSGILTYYKNNLEVGDKVDIVYKRADVNRVHRVQSVWWYFLFASGIGLGIFVMYLSTKMKSERWDEGT